MYYCNGGTFQHNTFEGNQAGLGGGVSLRSSHPDDFSNNAIIHNQASSGGGLYLDHSWGISVDSNTIAENEADTGGGIYLDDSDRVTLQHNIVSDNSATGFGGGLYQERGKDTTMIGNTFSGNDALDGGGLYLYPIFDDVGTLFEENTVISNTAYEDGGGLYLAHDSSFLLTNNIIANNEASQRGDQLFLEPVWPTLVAELQHNTLAHATQGEEAVYVGEHTALYMTNTIIVSHTVGIVEDGTDSAVVADFTFFANNGIDYQGNVTSINEVTGNSAFADPSAGDYHLALLSDAIDAGLDAGVHSDIDHDPRPYGAGFDIGADEAIRIGMRLEPDYVHKTAPGTTLTYCHTLTNIGLLAETFMLSLDSNQGWAQLMTSSPIALNPGLTETVVISVPVPPDGIGLMDIAVITVSSVLSPTVFDTAINTTSVVGNFFLPLVVKQYSP